ncbi:MAG: peptide chain release factor N(5)-glutamine methyltransferase [Lachnospiraceae bacterium]|nr:peptide chain release factor N(5)-glutamine methyltransferase [Lachnospiraceae bacterium]
MKTLTRTTTFLSEEVSELTYRRAMEMAASFLAKQGIEEARTDASLLMEYASGMDRTHLILEANRPMDDAHQSLYEAAIRRRGERIPLQHITGEQEFMGLSFHVTKDVLIPRFDTELLAELALEKVAELQARINENEAEAEVNEKLESEIKAEVNEKLESETGTKPNVKAENEDQAEAIVEKASMSRRDNGGCHKIVQVLDLCTGSGCLGISIKKLAASDIKVTASDISEAALEVARGNARTLGAEVEFVHSDLFQNLPGRYDLIVSNPPYIATREILELTKEVKEGDPMSALDGGEDGLDFYRQIIEEAPAHLNAGGEILFEIGYDQGEAVEDLLQKAGFTDTFVRKDLAGLDRIVGGKWCVEP